VLSRLQQQGLVLNIEKCQFGVAGLDYLGHRVSTSGIRPTPDCVRVINEFPRPRTTTQLQTFLGMANFYRRFLPGAARVLRPLTDAVRRGQAVSLEWSAEMAEAFNVCKAAIAVAVELAHPAPEAEIFLSVDASATHVGAVLQQRTAGQSARPLAFFSAKLDSAQEKYSAFDRELLACYLAIRHFCWILEGRTFHVLTDHKPLCFALHRLSGAWTACQQRHLSYIAEFTSDVRHVAGVENVVADALSRPAAAVTAPAPSTIDFEQLAREQQRCLDTLRLAAESTLHVQ
jgi:RNase H-like domain found in reverse transcriptase